MQRSPSLKGTLHFASIKPHTKVGRAPSIEAYGNVAHIRIKEHYTTNYHYKEEQDNKTYNPTTTMVLHKKCTTTFLEPSGD